MFSFSFQEAARRRTATGRRLRSVDAEKLAPVTKAHSGVTYKPILDSHLTLSHSKLSKGKKRPRSQSPALHQLIAPAPIADDPDPASREFETLSQSLNAVATHLIISYVEKSRGQRILYILMRIVAYVYVFCMLWFSTQAQIFAHQFRAGTRSYSVILKYHRKTKGRSKGDL